MPFSLGLGTEKITEYDDQLTFQQRTRAVFTNAYMLTGVSELRKHV